MKITTNKDNWSGEEITVKINQAKRSFSLFGYDFVLDKTSDLSKEDHPVVFYDITSPSWDVPLGVVVHEIDAPNNRFQNESYEAWNGSIGEGNLSRTGNSIYEAAIRMLCNVL